MSKRSASNDLNRDNWDSEDAKEELGSFNRAPGDTLKNRVIRKAKRSLTSNSSDGNAFSGSSPFASFSGFTASSTPFSFKKTETPSIENNQSNLQNNDATKNGGASADQSNQIEKTLSSQTEKVGNNSTKTHSLEYYRQLQSLNESVLKWMELHLSKNKCCDFTPVFNDYKKHLETLNFTYPVQKKIDEGKDAISVKGSFTADFTSKSNDSNSSSKVSVENANKDETDYGNNFTARPTNTSTYSCGIKPALTATSSATPTGPTSSSKEEEKNEVTESEKPLQFTFGNKTLTGSTGFSSGFSFASAIAAQKTEQAKTEEENYEPPKNDFVAVTEEDAIYSKKCKLFFKKGETFADKGVGMLHIKSIEGKTQLLVRADTNLGNILLNIMLSASLPMSRTGKNNVLLVCVPNPPVDVKNPDSKEAIPMLIRVKTAEDADELLDILNKHKT